MKKLVESVINIVDEEYQRASDKFGPINNSDHESAAIILEEFEEAADEQSNAIEAIHKFWDLVKLKDATDADKKEQLGKLGYSAMLAACEFIQVAAMAYKATATIDERKEQQ